MVETINHPKDLLITIVSLISEKYSGKYFLLTPEGGKGSLLMDKKIVLNKNIEKDNKKSREKLMGYWYFARIPLTIKDANIPKHVPTKRRNAKKRPLIPGRINLLIKDTHGGMANPPNKANRLTRTKNITREICDWTLEKNKVNIDSSNQGKAYPILINTIIFFFLSKCPVYKEEIICGNVQKKMKSEGNNPIIKLDLVNNVKKAGKTVVYPTRYNPKLSKPELATFKVKFQL